MNNTEYEETANELTRRILALIPENPEIMTIDSPFDLFRMGLKCDDLGPSLAQASVALGAARRIHAESSRS